MLVLRKKNTINHKMEVIIIMILKQGLGKEIEISKKDFIELIMENGQKKLA